MCGGGVQVLHYAEGQHYDVHHDYFVPARFPGSALFASVCMYAHMLIHT